MPQVSSQQIAEDAQKQIMRTSENGNYNEYTYTRIIDPPKSRHKHKQKTLIRMNVNSLEIILFKNCMCEDVAWCFGCVSYHKVLF